MAKEQASEKTVVSEFTVTYTGSPDITTHQIYSNNGFSIAKGETVKVNRNALPEEFTGSVNDLYEAIQKIPGMEVSVDDNLG